MLHVTRYNRYSSKLWGWALVAVLHIIVAFLLLAGGCAGNGPGLGSDPLVNVPEEKKPLRLESAELRPIIFGGEISSARYPLQDGRILAVASGFYLDIVFNDALNPAQIQSAVQVRGSSEINFTVSQLDSASGNDHILSVYAADVLPGTYQLTVTSVLSGKNTLSMEEQVIISLQLDSQTEGSFFLLDSSGFPRPISYEECRNGLALSDTAKTFIIQFNQDVNQVSIQDSILSGLKEQPAIASFSWLTPRQLRVNLTQLQTGMSYHLLVDQGVDNKGNGILGACYFRTGKASNVGVIQLATNEMHMLYQFSEERFSGIRSQIILNRALLQTGSSFTFCFSLGAKQLSALPSLRYDLAVPQSYREPVWLDYDHLFGFDAQDNSINLVSVPDRVADPVFTLPDRPVECRLSPNGLILAVTFRASTESRKVDLMLIDIQKKTLLHHVQAFAQPYITPAGYSAINLTWSGNDSFLYVDDGDILRAYLSSRGQVMDRKNTIEKDSRILDYLPDEDLLLCKPVVGGADSLCLIQDNKSRLLTDIPISYQDFYCILVDEETILFQSGGKIYRYSIPEQEPELIGSGLMLGLSS
ncbi:MAG: hypothetical protein LBH09_00780, partial [Peptococcaceae bacterium]|nr:hypothetical protein [Peptococcaceae bacterium]